MLDVVLEREVAPGARLLTVGCGPRSGLEWLARRGPVVACDADVTQGRVPGPPFVAGLAEALPFADRSFDAVLALDVLEHVDDDAAASRELARTVRPGGVAVVTVPALAWLWSPHDDVNHHRRRYTPGMLREALTRGGLDVTRLTFFNTLLFPPIAVARLLQRVVPRAAGAPRSDMERTGDRLLGSFLAWTFALERHVVGRGRLPIGVSLLAVGRPRSALSADGSAAR